MELRVEAVWLQNWLQDRAGCPHGCGHPKRPLDMWPQGCGYPDGCGRGWQVAADPTTRSPVRLAEAGPWWDESATTTDTALAVDVAALEAKLDAVDGQRLRLQQQAREQLAAERRPVARLSVLQRAVELLDNDDAARRTSTSPRAASYRLRNDARQGPSLQS